MGKVGSYMKIIKRNGTEAVFDSSKISMAIRKANNEAVESERLTEEQIEKITLEIEKECLNLGRAAGVEEIQDMVEDRIMAERAFSVARKYITYRYQRALIRKANSTDDKIMSLIECSNEEVKQENSCLLYTSDAADDS